VVTAVLLLLIGCTRPQGAQATPTLIPSSTPVANHGPLTIAFPVFHAGEAGVTYAPVTLSASGGVAPYAWSVSVGALPGGLTLSGDGVISGTPTQNGYFTFSIQVFDAGSNDTAGLPATIPIVPRLTASLVSACASECTVELGCVTVCGTFGQVSGGAAPLTYSLKSGVLPAGTTLAALSLNGTFIGLPGRLQFTVQVADVFGATTTITPSYNLIPHISLSGTVLCQGSYINPCTAKIPYSGGTPGGHPSVGIVQVGAYCPPNFTCPPPPTGPPGGFTATAGNGYVTVGVPANCARACPNGYTGAITIRLSDRNLCSAGTNCVSGTAVVDVYMVAG
jgi:hypothetical protein